MDDLRQILDTLTLDDLISFERLLQDLADSQAPTPAAQAAATQTDPSPNR